MRHRRLGWIPGHRRSARAWRSPPAERQGRSRESDSGGARRVKARLRSFLVISSQLQGRQSRSVSEPSDAGTSVAIVRDPTSGGRMRSQIDLNVVEQLRNVYIFNEVSPRHL